MEWVIHETLSTIQNPWFENIEVLCQMLMLTNRVVVFLFQAKMFFASKSVLQVQSEKQRDKFFVTSITNKKTTTHLLTSTFDIKFQ